MEDGLRLDNLVIHGLAEEPCRGGATGESQPKYSFSSGDGPVVETIQNLCRKQLKQEISESDISFAYRIPG